MPIESDDLEDDEEMETDNAADNTDAGEGANDPESDETENEAEGDGEGEADDEAEGEGKAGKADDDAPKARGARRIAALTKRVKEEKEARIRAETLAEERARTNGAASAGVSADEAKRLREEKLALLTPEEKRDFINDEKLQHMQQTVLLTQLQTQDALDRSAYQAQAAGNAVYAKHAAEVERRLSAERNAGRNWPRETVLAQILGESQLRAKPDKRKQEQARERMDSAKGRSVSGRSNTVAPRGKGRESLEQLEARLENVQF